MKTLIFNGSPRKNGDTASLINILTDRLHGDIMTVDCYYADISPCIDCRKCRDALMCPINDEMQSIYRYIEDCDNIVIASPVYYSELTGRLLDTASRLQMYFSARFFRKENPPIKPKKGAVILVGGGNGSPQKAFETAVCILHTVNTYDIHPLVCSHSTDNIPAAKDETAVSGVHSIADFFNNVGQI